jgi:hypothetical protein
MHRVFFWRKIIFPSRLSSANYRVEITFSAAIFRDDFQHQFIVNTGSGLPDGI